MTEAIEQRIREQAADLERRWSDRPAVEGVERTYTGEDVIRLQGSFHVEHSIARRAPSASGSWSTNRIRRRAGRHDRWPGRRDGQGRVEAIYLSGWQVAADANLAGQTYPDQSLYPANSVPRSCAASTTR